MHQTNPEELSLTYESAVDGHAAGPAAVEMIFPV